MLCVRPGQAPWSGVSCGRCGHLLLPLVLHGLHKALLLAASPGQSSPFPHWDMPQKPQKPQNELVLRRQALRGWLGSIGFCAQKCPGSRVRRCLRAKSALPSELRLQRSLRTLTLCDLPHLCKAVALGKLVPPPSLSVGSQGSAQMTLFLSPIPHCRAAYRTRLGTKVTLSAENSKIPLPWRQPAQGTVSREA